jgi:hypothetical protein
MFPEHAGLSMYKSLPEKTFSPRQDVCVLRTTEYIKVDPTKLIMEEIDASHII